jgi:hypothetical protein
VVVVDMIGMGCGDVGLDAVVEGGECDELVDVWGWLESMLDMLSLYAVLTILLLHTDFKANIYKSIHNHAL